MVGFVGDGYLGGLCGVFVVYGGRGFGVVVG